MAENINVNIRMDKELKQQADELFSELGLNMTTAINMFTRQAVRQGKIPFEISLTPNAETIEAMEEARKISKDPDIKGYRDSASLFKALEE